MKNCYVIASFTAHEHTDALLVHVFEQPMMGREREYIIAHGYNAADGDWGYGSYFSEYEKARREFNKLLKL